MHPNNPHNASYNFTALIEANPQLSVHVLLNQHQTKTIDFANPFAVFELNKALLILHYKLKDYTLPEGYLCPAVPGRADYLCYINDLLEIKKKPSKNKTIKGLDVGVGANCIYPIIGAQQYNWAMVGVDIQETSVTAAKHIVSLTPQLTKNIEIRYQENNANIFKEAIQPEEYFDFTMCNPPFHASEEEALKGTRRKLANISAENRSIARNFGGRPNELWCNGGEALFIKRMIKQSLHYKEQVGTFTTLVSNKAHLTKLYKQLDKAKATHKTIIMNIGNKQSRLLTWHFNS